MTATPITKTDSGEKRICAMGKALVADDERSNRIILTALLKQLGYEVIEAKNGIEAVELYKSEHPDLVLMDVLMPAMNGYDAVQQIKSAQTDHFTPVIFLTGMTNEDDLARCIEVGGDDFVTKPFSRVLLTSKIHAMERISKLHRQVNRLYARTQQDQAMAEEVFSGAVITGNVALDSIHTLLKPAEQFSGDVLLTAYSPSGDLNIMMGDFTGHGLAAALGAMPASEVFRAMTSKGFSTQQILAGINSKLLGLLPTNMFMAVQFVTVSCTLDYITICNCGMPNICILDADDNHIKHRTPSLGMPLGISGDIDFQECIEVVKINLGDKILLVSDGVTEAINPSKEQFTSERLEAAIFSAQEGESSVKAISRALDDFCGDANQADDISLAEIPCDNKILQLIEADQPDVVGASIKEYPTSKQHRVEFNMTLHGKKLSDADPIPLLINHIHEIEGLGEHRRLLFTILTELYNNALDHGVLNLDSELKTGQDGFTHYFTEREKRLETLEDGFISISITTQANSNGGEMIILVADSGEGFDFSASYSDPEDPVKVYGRGIQLVRELCQSVTYMAPGNQVKAIFTWDNK